MEAKRVITTNPHRPPTQEQGGEEEGQGQTTTPQTTQPEDQNQVGQDTSGQTVAPQAPETPPEEFRYTNPRLANRTPAEIEGLYGLAEQTVRQQGQQISDLTRRMQNLETAPPKKEETKITSQEFFADPGAAIENLLDRQIAPLREEVAEAKKLATAPAARDGLRRQFEDWDQVEPYVDMLLQQQDFPDPTDPGLLSTLYYTAKGVMATQGITTSSPEPHAPQGVATGGTPPGMAPPQHRASTPPPPPRSTGERKELRALTELEKRLAREWKMTDEEYLYWQELDEREVPTSKYGMPEETTDRGGNQR